MVNYFPGRAKGKEASFCIFPLHPGISWVEGRLTGTFGPQTRHPQLQSARRDLRGWPFPFEAKSLTLVQPNPRSPAP
ncbi:MAG: hypothetical protein A2600_05070 [Candidatus Lambdaproteobacteria bacterium RIFOXYD1_FULL_56_27]|uniref:Uncharacterized protein n=1 Tax=Candidatus Lambdaproteobacteria bacterium RIFOXYD2_FULL_56_26 TaxID=1817773 RepID=A0A1F6GS35_9PROT|nr:MAG: hypothetical protein A2426_07925 [Candidatus Lambdaproteobacteria bacterium RIFOXYC1_FULL_56_13]OGH00811.1 MAG: hypothetical protein A2557_03815 [Candidatus Lambdaproteobacteria bacterium RIFOXYD2_FULL_56_26]OGH09924.1 MAG: hypothetical protein A2600_05070 [Candidatus Lambdaproteobacteria bacterium RIFOXYD1_FULL_56_27]